ncbi:uncharacterized protein LOC117172598 isoform X2 [Belonocnema kinseyi]|nr:uncharacterized protein LOC117172598 isoform X2 [Belonocnema kinseyi]
MMKHLDSSEHKRRLFNLFTNVDNSKHNKTHINSVSEPTTKMNNQPSGTQNKPSRKSKKPNYEDHNQSTHVAQNEDVFKNKSFLNITNFNLLYKCYVCNTTADSDFQLLDHLNDHKHKNSLSTLPRDFVPYIYCPVCKSDIFEDEEMISHLESDGHKTRLVDVSEKSGSKIENSNEKQADLQINLVSGSKTILDELCSEMIRRPRKPNSDLKNKIKITPHFSEEYSKMFLEKGSSNIFNVDQRKMKILKSGIELSFLLHDERLCLVCNQRMPNNQQSLYEHLLNVDHIRKLDQLVINDLEFEHFRDQFSDLALAKEFLIEVNDDVAFCFPCKVEIENDDNAIKNHVERDENHRVECQEQKELTQDIFKKFIEQHNNFWYIVQRFWCQVCNAKFEYDIDFVEHIEGKKHVREFKKLLAKEVDICYDVCIPCASMSMGLPDTYTKHCEDKMHKYLVKSQDYAVPEMIKPAMNLLNNVEETAESLVLESNAAQFSEKKIGLVLKRLEELVKSHYPEAKAYVFGSRASYLAFSGSDVDIFLDCGNAYNGTQLLSKTREYLLNSQICFESQPDEWDLKEVLLKVRAPIIRVSHRELGLNCDVSFTSGLTVEKTKIVRLFMISYPPCRKMVLYLKKWLNTCLLTDTQGLTTFGITWLVIFYLQQIEILPSIAELIKSKSNSKIIAGWETGIGQKIPIKHSSLKFQELLRGFFEFYASYEYRSCVISPLMGKSLRKQDFTDKNVIHLPPEMESYSRCIESKSKPEIFRIESPLCLQDPIDLAQNITRSVSKLILRCFIQYCRTSVEKLSNLR